MKALQPMVAACALLLSGCATPDDMHMAAKPTRVVDEFTGVTKETLTTPPFGGEMKDGARVFFNLIHETDSGGSRRAYLCANYKGFDRWLFIQPGASLIFLIDGETEELRTPDGSLRFRDADGPTVRERAFYPVTMEFCGRIASAQTVKVRLAGQSHAVDKTLSRGAQKTFAEFANKLSK